MVCVGGCEDAAGVLGVVIDPVVANGVRDTGGEGHAEAELL